MTVEDEVYAAWLDILGSGTAESKELHDSLQHLHDMAEASHGTREALEIILRLEPGALDTGEYDPGTDTGDDGDA